MCPEFQDSFSRLLLIRPAMRSTAVNNAYLCGCDFGFAGRIFKHGYERYKYAGEDLCLLYY